jgi:YVTN family beta-propeller protein
MPAALTAADAVPSDAPPALAPRPAYLSPEAIAVDGPRKLAYTALTTAKAVDVTNLADNKTTRIALEQDPNELLLSPDGNTLYVVTGGPKGLVEIYDTPAGTRRATIPVGHTPSGLALSADGKTLYVANRFNDNIAVIDLANGNKTLATIPALREPRVLVLTPDGKTLAAANFIPHQAATDLKIASAVTLIDTEKRAVRTHVVLEVGAQSPMGLVASPDGRYLYTTHILSRFGVPITQLDRGWVNTAALAIISLKDDSLYATVLLDDPDNGAANPGGICLSGDGPEKGSKLYITVAGTHEILSLDLAAIHQRIDGFYAGTEKIPYITKKEEFGTSLSFTSAYKKRHRLKGLSPRSIVWLPGSARPATDDAPGVEGEVLVASHFSTAIEKVTLGVGKKARIETTAEYPLGTEPAPDAIRRGELNFWDASICYQQWQSCNSCHAESRSDGLNWDQINDGMGNPKNSKSMLFTHYTPPRMITGIRKDAELAVRRGILHTLFTRQPESFAQDIDEYLKSLRPVESPWLAQYRAKDPTGKKGPALFDKASCSNCHNGYYLTDMQKHNVGVGIEEYKDFEFDTPTLREIWRTSPYLYDGRAVTIRDVLTTHNKEDMHGSTKNLTKEEIDLLSLYILTL